MSSVEQHSEKTLPRFDYDLSEKVYGGKSTQVGDRVTTLNISGVRQNAFSSQHRHNHYREYGLWELGKDEIGCQTAVRQKVL